MKDWLIQAAQNAFFLIVNHIEAICTNCRRIRNAYIILCKRICFSSHFKERVIGHLIWRIIRALNYVSRTISAVLIFFTSNLLTSQGRVYRGQVIRSRGMVQVRTRSLKENLSKLSSTPPWKLSLFSLIDRI